MNETSLTVSLVVFAALAVGSFLLLRGREPRQQREILSNAHYAYSVVIALVALGYAVTLLYGAYLWWHDPEPGVSFWETPEPPLLVAASFVFGLYGWANVLAGRRLLRGTRPGLCVGMSFVNLCFFPLGTMLGVATLFVLMRGGGCVVDENRQPPLQAGASAGSPPASP